jgi:hypothetical protein
MDQCSYSRIRACTCHCCQNSKGRVLPRISSINMNGHQSQQAAGADTLSCRQCFTTKQVKESISPLPTLPFSKVKINVPLTCKFTRLTGWSPTWQARLSFISCAYAPTHLILQTFTNISIFLFPQFLARAYATDMFFPQHDDLFLWRHLLLDRDPRHYHLDH